MQEFSFSPWLRRRVARLRIYRWIVNSWWLFLAVILFLNLLQWAVPGLSPMVIGLVWLPFGVLLCVIALPWFLIGSGFLFGFITCPSCDQRYAPKFPPGWVRRRCQNCGFDINTMRHATSNLRWSGP